MEKKLKFYKASKNPNQPCVYVGDKIKLYGKVTTVLDFYAAWNEGLNKYETLIITEGRGDPFERTLNAGDIELVFPEQTHTPRT